MIMVQKQLSAIEKMQAFYAMTPDAPIYQKEFGYYTLETWQAQGYLKKPSEVTDYDAYLREVFHCDEPATIDLTGLGWCEAGFFPAYEVKLLEDRGQYELVQDYAGRSVLYFKGRRNGFMPEYADHPVKDMTTWERDVKWRMDPNVPGRLELTRDQVRSAVEGRRIGMHITQRCVGGFMYLRSLMGAENLLLAFYDQPELIHDCMKTWFALADRVIAEHQKSVVLDEFFIGEDICYNVSSLISPDMIREFLFPYYQQLIENIKARNGGHSLVLQLDTDGFCPCVMDLYRELGFNYFSPMEVASGCDVVELGRRYPDTLILGGIDKRILASTPQAIYDHVTRIMDTMKHRGGYIPTCDHGVPEEVSFENYMYYRSLMQQY